MLLLLLLLLMLQHLLQHDVVAAATAAATAVDATTAAAAAEAAEEDFNHRSRGGVPDEIAEVQLGGAPLGIGVVLKQANLAPSTSQAMRLIEGGGVRVDGSVVSDKGLQLPPGNYVIQVGKRKFARVLLVTGQ